MQLPGARGLRSVQGQLQETQGLVLPGGGGRTTQKALPAHSTCPRWPFQALALYQTHGVTLPLKAPPKKRWSAVITMSFSAGLLRTRSPQWPLERVTGRHLAGERDREARLWPRAPRCAFQTRENVFNAYERE